MLHNLELFFIEFNNLALYARLAICPRSRSISILLDCWEYRFPWENVAYLLKASPDIASFQIKGKNGFPHEEEVEALPPIMMQLYDHFNHLVHLYVRPVYLTHLVTLNRLKALRMLTILSVELVEFYSPSRSFDFPCLTHMWIGIDMLPGCTTFFKRPSFQNA
jgi:hypothetical protein